MNYFLDDNLTEYARVVKWKEEEEKLRVKSYEL